MVGTGSVAILFTERYEDLGDDGPYFTRTVHGEVRANDFAAFIGWSVDNSICGVSA